MNADLIRKLADFIEEQTDTPFNMAAHETCCIGFLGRMFRMERGSSAEAAELLDVSVDDALEMFIYADWSKEPLSRISRASTVKALRAWAKTG